MKTLMKIVGFVLMLTLLCIPAYAITNPYGRGKPFGVTQEFSSSRMTQSVERKEHTTLRNCLRDIPRKQEEFIRALEAQSTPTKFGMYNSRRRMQAFYRLQFSREMQDFTREERNKCFKQFNK